MMENAVNGGSHLSTVTKLSQEGGFKIKQDGGFRLKPSYTLHEVAFSHPLFTIGRILIKSKSRLSNSALLFGMLIYDSLTAVHHLP
jgi:hypothetical protein